MHEWFQYYQRDRPLRARVDNVPGDSIVITMGVQQVSVLGLMIFLININFIFIETLTADNLAIAYHSSNGSDLALAIPFDLLF